MPVLACPKPGLTCILHCDGRDLGVGAVLSQEGKERVINYASKRLIHHQGKLSVTRKELLAIVTFIDHFRHYLGGQKFLLRTDHGSLRWLFVCKNPLGQVTRWLEVLVKYDFEIQYGIGYKQLNTDGVSRQHYKLTTCRHRNPEEEENFEECTYNKEECQSFNAAVYTVVDLE